LLFCVVMEITGRLLFLPPRDQNARSSDRGGPPEGRVIRMGGVVRSVAFSPDGRLFAAGVAERLPAAADRPDGAVVWDRAAREEVAHLWHGQEVLWLMFEPDSQSLSRGSKDGSVTWKFAKKEQCDCTVGYGGIHALAASPDGARVAAGFGDGPCRGQIDEWM